MLLNHENQTNGCTKLTIVLCFILIIGAVPLTQLVKEIYFQEAILEANIFRKPPTTANIRLYEKGVEENSIVTKWVRPWFQMLLTRLGNQGNSKVVIGRDNWLFYRPGLDYITKPGTNFYRDSGPLDAITAFHQDLKTHDVHLILLPIPNKSTIYPEYLSRRYNLELGPPVNPHADEFFQKLKEKGINVVDPADILWKGKNEPVYMKQDTHWSPQGMKLVADYLARVISSSDWIKDAPARHYKTQEVQVNRYGDLYDMLDLPKRYSIFKPMSMTVEKILNNETNKPFSPDENSPIILLGDSFVNIFSKSELGFGEQSGLGEHLAYNLGISLDIIAINDGGPTTTREQFARRPNALAGKKLVIWQFATRDLTNSESLWKIVKFPEPKKIKSSEPKMAKKLETKPALPEEKPNGISETKEDVFIVVGEISIVSNVPDPSQVAYSECVTYIKYRVLSVEQGDYQDDDLLAVFWGMKDSKLMPAARFQPGEKHRLKLEPFEKHKELSHVMQADDTEDYEHVPLWVIDMQIVKGL